jgi:O-antigen ligase
MLVKVLLLIPGLVAAFVIPLGTLFTGWLSVAPFIQGPSSHSASGHIFFKYLFLVPPLVFVARMLMGEHRRARLLPVDAVPLLYVAYVAFRVILFPSPLSGPDANGRAIYAGVGLAAIGYYVVAFGIGQAPVRVARALLWSAPVVAVFALVDELTRWNPWHTSEVEAGTQHRRVVATFTSPWDLGAYLGICVVFAVAILAFNGPHALRRPAIVSIALSVPAIFFTLSRGPALGAAATCVALVLIANRSRWPGVIVLAMAALVLIVAWGAISTSSVYQQRLGVTETVHTRQEIQRVTLALIRKKPILGWGYNTFDKAKLTVSNRDPRFDALTSHDTFLTVAAELGLVGLLGFASWFVIGWRGLLAGRQGRIAGWTVGAGVGAVAAFTLGAFTYDARFFSLVSALPWIGIGVVRSQLVDKQEFPQAAHR